MQDWISILVLMGSSSLSGGGITALITILANGLSTKRQNEIEIKKHRMDILSSNMYLFITD